MTETMHALPRFAMLLLPSVYVGPAGTVVNVLPYEGGHFGDAGAECDRDGDYWTLARGGEHQACIGKPGVGFKWVDEPAPAPEQPRVAVEVRGGVVVAVRSSVPVSVEVVDWDDIAASEDSDEDEASAEALLATLPHEAVL